MIYAPSRIDAALGTRRRDVSIRGNEFGYPVIRSMRSRVLAKQSIGERADDANNWKDRYRTLGVLGYEEFIVPTFFVTARGTLNKFYNGLLVLISYVLPVSRIAAYVFSKP